MVARNYGPAFTGHYDMRSPIYAVVDQLGRAADIGDDLRHTVAHGFKNGHAERFAPTGPDAKDPAAELGAPIERVNIALSRMHLASWQSENDRSLKKEAISDSPAHSSTSPNRRSGSWCKSLHTEYTL